MFILSDSRDHDVVRQEQALWARLCAELDAAVVCSIAIAPTIAGARPATSPISAAAGARRYTYFVVLDADSVMSGETLVRLVQLMEANPDAGLIQTVPRPIGGETPLARILQFSASLYGPLLASG